MQSLQQPSVLAMASGEIHHQIAPFLCNTELSTTTVSKSAVFCYWGVEQSQNPKYSTSLLLTDSNLQFLFWK